MKHCQGVKFTVKLCEPMESCSVMHRSEQLEGVAGEACEYAPKILMATCTE